jgi:polysaccharide deacetylase family protein (PEP-CTERM system associated)
MPSHATATNPAALDVLGAGQRHILSIAVEDYFQASAFRSLITTKHWYRFEPRIERNTRRTLDLLDEFGAKATFFTLGWVADEMPGIVREIVARGHEVASKGYYHRSIEDMTPEEFREDLRRSRTAIENAAGTKVLGYRVARGHLGLEDLWALDILAEEGFTYDSSFYPRWRSVAREPWRRLPFVHRNGNRELWEFPLSTWHWYGWHLPIAGGAYVRHLPHRMVSRAIKGMARDDSSLLVMYFHVWELDDDLPKITAAPGHAQLKQYRNIEKMPDRVRYYLKRYAFESVRDHLGLAPEPAPVRVEAPPAAAPVRAAGTPGMPVTLVAPCYNEERVLPYLANTLKKVAADFEGLYDLSFVFVDDGSSDGTWATLQRTFGGWPNCKLVQHERNSGVAAAIVTGIRHAHTEVIASIDCDCTYDPHQIADLIPRLGADVALVTASPYHPAGIVKNVPGWRLMLSKTLSFMYRQLFRQKLHTFTSCFRVYRRSQVADIQLGENGFLGVAEMLMILDRQGKTIVEHPALLEVRLLGHSKMKTLRTIAGHLRMIRRLLAGRIAAPEAPASPPLVGYKDSA